MGSPAGHRGAEPTSAPGSDPVGQPTAPARDLADILREAGVEASGRGGRRRRTDDNDESDGAPDPPRMDTAPVLTRPSVNRGWAPVTWPPAADSAPDADPWPSAAQAAEVGHADEAAQTPTALPAPGTDGADRSYDAADRSYDRADRSYDDTDSTDGWGGPGAAEHGTGSANAAAVHVPAHAIRSASPMSTAAAPDSDPDDPDRPTTGGIGAWVILVVELLAALGLGVAVWFAFSALWELLPFAAAFAGPLVVTGLVAVAGALRARTGRNPLGLPTLCILVFAGMVLVVLPAATVVVP